MILKTIILVLFLFSLSRNQLINITDCNSISNMIANNNTVYYKLMNNINCLGYLLFLPAGNASQSFQGTLDGNGFSIANLTLNLFLSNYLGLIGYGYQATLKNLNLINFQINGNTASYSYFGSLVGYCCSCNISNVNLTTSDPSFTNNINGHKYSGGLVGYLCSSTISNCIISNTIVSGYCEVGGLCGYSQSSIISFCYNLGILSNPNALIVNGTFGIGGLIGLSLSDTIKSCGVHQGVISATGLSMNSVIGGIVGNLQTPFSFSKLYVLQNVIILSPNSYFVGGISDLNSFSAIGQGNSTDGTYPIGYNCSRLYSNILMKYDETNIWGGDYLLIQYEYSYRNCNCSSGCPPTSLSPTANVPTSQAPTTIIPTTLIPTTNVPTSLIPSTNFPRTLSPITSFPTSNLPTTQLPTSQVSTTNAPTTLIPTTNIPTSLIPSTNFPTTLSPTSNLPTTQLPTSQVSTTNAPTTLIPTTNVPTSLIPSTNFPTTLSPTSNLPTTQLPTTQVPVTYPASVLTSLLSTTQVPTSQQPTILVPTTQNLNTLIQNITSISSFVPSSSIPPSQISTTSALNSNFPSSNVPSSYLSTQILTTSPTNNLNCFYQVLNCQFCSLNPIQVDITQFNISCSLIGGVYIWIFKNSTSNTIYNNFTITLNGSTNFIEGNFTQTSTGKLVFVLNSNQNSSSFPSLNVSGCVSINGTISLFLNTQPQQGNSSFQIISYNCSQQTNISSNQIQISSSYKNNECDQTSSQVINSPNSISVSLSSSLGSKCGGTNKGLIIGLAVGIPGFMALLIVGILAFIRFKRLNQFNERIRALQNEMTAMNTSKIN